MTTHLLSCLLGAFAWTFVEYLMHRFNGHALKGRTRFSREHLAHHADPGSFTSWPTKIRLALPLASLFTIAAIALAGPIHGALFSSSLLGAYLGYEWLHERAHTHAPSGPYGRWARLHHFSHHFSNPTTNHGVTTPIWDIVFRTYVPTATLTVPQRFAMQWLVDERGGVQKKYGQDYRLR